MRYKKCNMEQYIIIPIFCPNLWPIYYQWILNTMEIGYHGKDLKVFHVFTDMRLEELRFSFNANPAWLALLTSLSK